MEELITLPDGFKSELGVVYNKARVKELTGKQQNYLMDVKSLQSGLSFIDRILEELIEGIYSEDGSKFAGTTKSALSKISTNDMQTLLIGIREKTYGNIFYLRANCSHCQKENEMKVDLNTLAVTQSAVEDKGKLKELSLPRSKKAAKIKLLGLDAIHKSHSIFKSKQSELLTATASLVLQSLDGKESPSSEDVMNLPALDIKYISDEAAKMGGKIDTTITHQCKYCEQDFDTELNSIDPSFLLHT